MERILDNQLSEENLNLSEVKFRGKLAGKSWKHEQYLDRLFQARMLIFGMGLIVFYPLITNYLFHDYFNQSQLIERVVLSLIMISCGLIYPKYRLAALIIALIPMSVIIMSYVLSGELMTKRIAFNVAIFFLIGTGIFYHFREKNIRKELWDEIHKRNPNVILPWEDMESRK